MEAIVTLTELLEIMFIPYLESRKTSVELFFCTSDGKRKIHVTEYFDDGKGHSGAFTSRNTPVAEKVFLEARRKGFISGKLEPGYTSRSCFLLTGLGKEEHVRLENERRVAEKTQGASVST